MAVVVSVEDFRNAFKEFCNPVQYKDCLLTRFLTQAQAYISRKSFVISDDIRLLLIQLMAAHLITLAEIDPTTGIVKSMGQSAGHELSASVDGVSVTREATLSRNGEEQWLQSTGYGQQYLAILQAHSIGIYFVGKPMAWGIK